MKRSIVRNSNTSSGEDAGYWISISDLMSGLLIIFILCLSYFMIEFLQEKQRLSEETKKWKEIDELRKNLLQDIEYSLIESGITNVVVDPAHGILRFPEGILFQSGRAGITESGMGTIHKLADVLIDVINRKKYEGRVETIFIEGHTDSVPIHTKKFESNWELSTKRAINAWNALLSEGQALEEMRNRKGEALFSCSGYADTRPIDANKTIEGRRENRRIDLRFAMAPPPTEDSERPIVKETLEGMAE